MARDGTILLAGEISGELSPVREVSGELSLPTERSGTDDYNRLVNKPSIEDVILEGNRTMRQLGVETATVQEVEAILYLD